MKKWMLCLLTVCVALGTSGALAFDAAEEITVHSREDGSGTRSAFVELMGVEAKNDAGEKIDRTSQEAVVTNSTSVMLTGVAGDTAAIGYVSLGSLNDTVKALSVDGVAPTTENIKAGTYKVSRPFTIATAEGVSEAALDFIGFILSGEGQGIIEENGYIAAVGDAPAYQGGAEGKVVVAGSSSVTPVMEKLKEAYTAINTGVEVQVQQSDSTTGMLSVLEGIYDIGMASRALKDSETEAGLTGEVIAMDGIAVIVHLDNPAEDLPAETIRQIFTGEALTWADAGVE